MKKLLIASIMIILASGVVMAKDLEITKQAGPYSVFIKLEKNPPSLGENNVSITIKDAAGKVIKDANVVMNYEMPAMPGMPAMRYKVSPQLKGDSYAGTLNFSMGGSWGLNIKITRSGKTDTVKFNVDVS